MRSLCACFVLAFFAAAALASDPAGRILEKKAVLPVPRSEAWHYWTTNEGFQKSVGVQGSDIEMKLGGKYEIYFSMQPPPGQRGSEGATVLAYHPLEFLAFTWNAPPSIPELRNSQAMTEVVVRFQDAPEGTLVTITQLITGRGQAWEQYFTYFDKAWPYVLNHMKEYASKTDRPTKGVSVPAMLNPLSHEAVIPASANEIWKAFTTKEGIESWMAAKGEIDLKVMGKLLTTYNKTATLGDEHTIENTIRAYVPDRLLAIQCTKTPKGFEHSDAFYRVWTVLYFDDIDGKQTRVRCVQLNYGDDPASQEVRKHFEAGNAYVLKKLGERFAKK